MIPSLALFSDFSSFEEALRANYQFSPQKAAPEQVDQIVEGARNLFEAGLPPIPNSTSLAVLLGISPRLISSMALRPTRYWRTFLLPKRGGGKREITAPRVFLKTIQTFILHNVLYSAKISDAAFGFTSGRGTLQNARQHLSSRFVWNTDIEEFFPSITHHKVRDVFLSLGFDTNMASVLGALCTYKGRLPQGAPTSPKLSNIICRPLDEAFITLAREYSLTYSRYADDITFSGLLVPPAVLVTTCDSLLEENGFRRNLGKTRLHGPHQARYVTGLVINEKVHPDRRTRRELRSMFHNVKLNGVSNLEDLNKLRGWAAYVHSYNADLGRTYLRMLLTADQWHAVGNEFKDD